MIIGKGNLPYKIAIIVQVKGRIKLRGSGAYLRVTIGTNSIVGFFLSFGRNFSLDLTGVIFSLFLGGSCIDAICSFRKQMLLHLLDLDSFD